MRKPPGTSIARPPWRYLRAGHVARSITLAQTMAVVLPTLIFTLVAWTTYRRAEAATEDELRRSAKFLAGHVQRLIENSNAVLREVERAVIDRADTQVPMPSLLHLKILKLKENLISKSLIVVADRDGRILFTSTEQEVADVFVADREYFIELRDGRADEIFVGTPVVGRLTGMASIPISRRLSKDDDFRGVALVAVSQRELLDTLKTESARHPDRIALLRDDGRVLSALPGDVTPASAAQNAGSGSPRLSPDESHVRWPKPDPNFTLGQLTAFHRVPGSRLTVVAARTRSSALRTWFHDIVALLTIFVAGEIGLVAAIRRAEASSWELVSANHRLQSTMDALSARVAIIDRVGRVVALNEACRQFAARHTDRVSVADTGTDYLATCADFVQGPDRGRICCELKAVLDGRLSEFRATYPYQPASGDIAWFRVMATSFAVTSAETLVVVVHEDVTEIKRSEAALMRATGQLLRRQDEERRRIARGLHDSTAQDLIGAEWEIKLARDNLHRTPAHADGALGRARDLVRTSIGELRTLSYLLHPPMLDEAGLPNALRWFLAGFERRTGITVTVVIDADVEAGRLPTDIEVALFRVAQEALTNVHRHAGVHSARLELRMGRGRRSIVLLVRDDGEGLASQDGRAFGDAPAGTGILSMQERLRALNGRLDIRSGDRGTEIEATVKLHA